jgi:tetratricopeptide (TPR) repeat protein
MIVKPRPSRVGACLCLAAILAAAGVSRGKAPRGSVTGPTPPAFTLGHQAERLSDHASHSQVTSEERALRELLARYTRGDVDGAVSGLLANPRDWSRRALDACLRRIDDHIKYHRRPQNRLSPARDERLERFLRADRLNVLVRSAVFHLEASRAVAEIDTVGSHVVESERAIDMLYGLRGDFDENGPVPWPIDDEPWDEPDLSRDRKGSVDGPAVEAFVSRWYSAAISRLQELVELRLAPALVERGLARFPRHAELLLARGSFIETRLALAQVDASVAPVLYLPDTRQRWRDELSDAEADFARAVQEAGPASEAAVRLARVRLLKEQVEQSRELLDRVLAADVPVEIRYLALLFRAAAADELGNVQDATRDYLAAVDSIPRAQTPMLALARIADEQNQPANARKWVERAVALGTGVLDPWRRYIQGQGWQVGARVASLRTVGLQ